MVGDALPRSSGQTQAAERKRGKLRAAIERALDLPAASSGKHYSVRDLKAHQLAVPVYQGCVDALGDDHPATRALLDMLDKLSLGCHRYRQADKADAYRAARDDASLAASRLALARTDEADQLLVLIEQELMPALAGLLRTMERRPKRTSSRGRAHTDGAGE